MSFLVLHMDKFKKEAVRGIQSHNERERESGSHPRNGALKRTRRLVRRRNACFLAMSPRQLRR